MVLCTALATADRWWVRDFEPQDVANTVWAFATASLGHQGGVVVHREPRPRPGLAQEKPRDQHPYSKLVSKCPQGSGPRGKILGNFWDNSEISVKFPGNFRDISGKCPGHFREISWKFPVNFRSISGTLPGNFRQISGTFPENFRDISGKFRGHV